MIYYKPNPNGSYALYSEFDHDPVKWRESAKIKNYELLTSAYRKCDNGYFVWLGPAPGNPVPAPIPAQPAVPKQEDPVNHPSHYTDHPSGVECIQITEHMGFNLGNALKYIWRCDLKADAIEDLKKARWYIDRELAKRTNPPQN